MILGCTVKPHSKGIHIICVLKSCSMITFPLSTVCMWEILLPLITKYDNRRVFPYSLCINQLI